ncbi:MAG TPA: flavodoxin domain-containing protein [Acidimicrobiales bacterium]
MRALVCYESMFGNTHHIAEAIGAGLGAGCEVAVRPIGAVTSTEVADADLVVVGAPTHVHGLPRPASRQGAAEKATGSETRHLEAEAEGPGVREWLQSLDHLDSRVAAFDTRVDMNPVVTGRASKGIDHKLRHAGGRPIAAPESFLVDREDVLVPGELERATAWGTRLAADLAASTV